MRDMPQKNRTIMAMSLFAAGLFLVGAAPFLVQSTLQPTLEAMVKEAASNPQHASGPNLLAIAFPFWRALIFVTGATSVAVVYPLWRGRDWSWPVALACLAIPAIGGMFMTLPFVAQVGGRFPPSMITALVGLLAYVGILLLRTDRGKKGIDLLVFILVGVVTMLGFVLALGGLGQFMARPGRPLFTEAKIVALSLSGPVSGIGMALIFAAIPLLAVRKPVGWWLGVIGGASLFAANLPTFVISRSGYYLLGSAAGLLLTVTLLVPDVKCHLVGSRDAQASILNPVS